MMRDPERIAGVLEAVRETWLREPDLRLGQILCAAARVQFGDPDPFYMEDDTLVAVLRAHGRWQVDS